MGFLLLLVYLKKPLEYPTELGYVMTVTLETFFNKIGCYNLQNVEKYMYLSSTESDIFCIKTHLQQFHSVFHPDPLTLGEV